MIFVVSPTRLSIFAQTILYTTRKKPMAFLQEDVSVGAHGVSSQRKKANYGRTLK